MSELSVNTNDRIKHRCCFTGHRPEKLTRDIREIKDDLTKAIIHAMAEGKKVFISGMSRGIDLWAAEIVLSYKKQNSEIKLVCAIPFEEFNKQWSREWQLTYQKVLLAADWKKIFYSKFSYSAFQIRNQWMVDHSSLVIAAYNGKFGGTYNTLRYAFSLNKDIRIIKA